MKNIHEIQIAFDNNPIADVGGVFLDISKAVNIEVWNSGFHSSCMHMGLKVNYLPYLRITFIIVNKE